MKFLGINYLGKNILFPILKDKNPSFAGSSADCSIYLPFIGISKKHFKIYFENGNWFIEDLNSKNGTFLNKIRIGKAILNEGDIISASFLNMQFFSKNVSKIKKIDYPEVDERITFENFYETETFIDFQNFKDRSLYFTPNIKFEKDIILGKDPVMYEVYRKLNFVISSNQNVLLVGKTGAGKEVFARAIHNSKFKNFDNFVPINCASIPVDLAEAELFGVSKGTATGVSERTGKILMANNGTLFLDEICSLPYEIQGKLLRALEEKQICPLGKNFPVKVNFCLISSIQEDPQVLIEKKVLRSDLYYRISEISIKLPSLSERREDIDIFIEFFLKNTLKKEKKIIYGIDEEALKILKEYDYPGNIRELKNIIEKIVCNTPQKGIVLKEYLPEELLIKKFPKKGKLDKDKFFVKIFQALFFQLT
ncbi:MAG: sigma 54-interacting transcriptional regulator [candidate division WOR-3 bacterium]